MKYSDINFDNNFIPNSRQTPWTVLFPHWYMEDDFLKSIGDEIELIKSKSLFKLLNIGVKPPVMLWKSSLSHKKYTITKNIKTLKDDELNNKIKTRAPLYKTYGTVTIKNYGEGFENLNIFLNESDGIVIKDYIDTNSVIELNLETQEFLLDGSPVHFSKQGQGLPYFITSRNNEEYQEVTPLHNEALVLSFFSHSINEDQDKVDLDIEIILQNVVFENEQNIEITSLELLPLDKVVLYAEYDFPENKKYNGMKKVYTKEYDPQTTVIYDMITTQFFTEKFYVEVYFKDVVHPYTIGFPCYKDAATDSIYHVNTELDALGDLLELQRREYKTNIPEEDYPFTFPEFYPYDIEQDYWYYQRLVNEYAWNDLAINRADIKDTEDNTVIRLHSINPFIEDFVVYANSTYPEDIEGINYNEYLPSFIYQETEYEKNTQVPFVDVKNLLRKDDNFAYTTLYSKSDNHITYEGYKTKELGLYFDLSDIPDNVNIDGFEIIIDTESTDNSIEKYNDNRTRLQIANNKALPGFIETSGHYELRRKNIVYGDKNTLFGLERIPQTNNYIEQKIVIGSFSAKTGERFKIPFAYYEDYDLDLPIKDPETGELLEEGDSSIQIDDDDLAIDNIQDVMIFFYNRNKECIQSTTAKYYNTIKENGTRYRYLLVETFPKEEVSTMNIISTEGNKHAFNIELDVQSHTNSDGKVMASVQGEYIKPTGYEGDLSYLLRNNGLYFIYTLSNDSKTNSSSVLIHNISLRVYYSPKKEKITLRTDFNRHVNEEDPCHLILGDLKVSVTNTGEKPCEAYVDIIYPDNLSLSEDCIYTQRLDVGSSIESTITVSYNQGEFCNAPIDGKYDIITVCNGVERVNTIRVESIGELYTSTSVDSQICFIEGETTLIAYVTGLNDEIINDGYVDFRINGYTIEDKYEPDTNRYVQNGQAKITFTPNDYEFIRSGTNDVEAIYSGTTKRNMSRGYGILWLNKNKVRMSLEIPDILVQKFESEATITVSYITEDGDELPMKDGNVSLFIEDEEMFTTSLTDGSATVSFQPAYNVGKVIAKAVYSGTDIFPGAEVTKEVMIIGGNATIKTPNIEARPDQRITLKSYIYDANDNKIPYGFVDYIIKDGDEVIYEYNNVIVYGGQAAHNYRIPNDAISLYDEEDEKEYQLIASYHSNIDEEPEVSSYSKIKVSRDAVKIIHHTTNFRYSNKEPLGFYIEVLNKNTGYPIEDGRITISIPTLGITIEEDIDENGEVRTIYSPIELSAQQWDELFNTSFSFENNELYEQVRDELKASYEQSDLWFHNNFFELFNERIGRQLYNNDKAPEKINFRLDGNKHLWFVNTETDDMEYIYSKDINDAEKHIFIRTSDDIKRYFDAGTHNVNITYRSLYQYKKETLKTKIIIHESNVNVDVHRQELEYGNNYSQIMTYVTPYREQLESNDEEDWIETGYVDYYIDGKLLCNANVVRGLSYVSNNEITRIPSGTHILMAEYIGNSTSCTYAFVDVKKVPSTINPDKYAPAFFNKVFPGKKAKLSVKIDANVTFEITGHINVYLNDTPVGYKYLSGEEDGHALIEIEIPKDLEVSTYKYRIEYSGDDRIDGCFIENELKSTKLPIKIEGDLGPIYATPGTECDLFFKITTEDEEENDDITQGKIVLIPLQYGENAYGKGLGCNVINNVANIKLKVPDTIQEQPYQYYLEYIKGTNYEDKILIFDVYVIEGYDPVIVDGHEFVPIYNEVHEITNIDLHPDHASSLKKGLWKVKDNGTIKLSSWQINKSGLLNNNFTITKDVIIEGDISHIEGNSEDYALNVPPYIETNIEELININPKIHDRSDFTEDEFNKLHLIDIQNSQINVNEFRLIDEELYYIRYDNSLMPIYLFDDGLYYAEYPIRPQNTVLNINGHNVTFKDLELRNGDWYNNFIINNDSGNLTINHCIVQKGVEIRSSSNLICNENIIYGTINPSKTYNIDNNWWGQNKAPLKTNNNIILKITSEKYPPVVGEQIDIRLQLIGENGKHYTLPQVPFKIYGETGNVHISSGYLVDSQVVTGYDDAIHQGEIYGEVDNEKVSMTIYDYDRKTEVISKSPKIIPIGYQITLTAIIQSCANKYYKFDNENNIISQSNEITNGYATFYIDNKKIGRTRVKKGKAELTFYSSPSMYYNNDELLLKVLYEPDDYYFSSQTESAIKFIQESDNIRYVSNSASDGGNGTYANPYKTIADALANVTSLSNSEEFETYTIYIKEGQYYDSNLDIAGFNAEFIKYDGEVVFETMEDKLATVTNGSLYLKGIDFIYNNIPYLIRNNDNLIIEDCIFYENHTIISNDFENTPMGTTTINKCAIVNVQNIVTDYNNNFSTSKCWFGVNEPNELLGFGQMVNSEWVPYILNDYILMDLKASKDIIYIGTAAHIIASIDKRYINGVVADYNEELPLRIALFTTSFGSLMPLKDFTHNKVAISFFNTTDNVNAEKIVIAADDNTNYYNTPLKLKASVFTTMGDPIESGILTFIVKQKNNQIVPPTRVNIENGTAILKDNSYQLKVGTYTLECIYVAENQTYHNSFIFDVKLPSLSLENVFIDNGDHLYNLIFDADVISQFEEPVNNVSVKCYIDNKYIKKDIIRDGRLSLNLLYNPILAGDHTLRIESINLESYQQFVYPYNFKSSEKTTYIDFEEKGMGQGETKNLVAYVRDDNHKALIDGTVTVAIDNNTLKDKDGEDMQISLYNGTALIPITKPLSNGQHSIVITYSGVPRKYKSAITIKNDFYVGLYPIKIYDVDTFTIEVGSKLNIKLNQILDTFDNKVTKGVLYFDVDDICLNEDNPVYIEDGTVNYILDTRRINIGTHDFTIRYYDDTHTYANTIISLRLIVTQIKTTISIDSIMASPNITKYVDYDITTIYSVVTNGVLKAYLDNKEIGTALVSAATKKQIPLSIPFKPNGDYTVLFKYHDDEAVFSNTEEEIHLSIARGQVNISTPCEAYYPNESFRFDININDIEGKKIDVGVLDVYIDNVLEYENVPVQFGYAYVELLLKQVKEYEISVRYKQNEYYRETLHKQIVSTNKINIKDIRFNESLSAYAGETKLYHLTFETLGDHKVEDGIVDFKFDGNIISSQHIQESQSNNAKEFQLIIPNAAQGTHTISILYHDSLMFNDKNASFEFVIVPDEIELTVDDITAELNNTVTITSKLSVATTGLIKFYIGPNEQSMQLIGVEELHDEQEKSMLYRIPRLYNDNQLKIKAEFRNNSKYQDKDAWATLTINQLDAQISLDIENVSNPNNNNEIYYQDIINIIADTNIIGSETIDFYIDGVNIGQASTNDEKKAILQYRLNKSYKAGTYNVKAKYSGSKVINSAEVNKELIINKYTPTLQTHEYDVYIGNKLELNNIVLGNRGIAILEGKLIKIMNNNVIPKTILNTPTIITIPEENTESFDINVQFTPLINDEHEDNEYNSFDEIVNINMMKNPINVRVLTLLPTVRGDTVDIHIKMSSDTTPLPVNLTALINEEQVPIVNGDGLYTYTLPIIDDKIMLSITIEDNDIFVLDEPFEFEVPYKNRFDIYISAEGNDNNTGAKDSPVATIQKALSLVENNGNIHLCNNIDIDENLNIEIPITINGYNDSGICATQNDIQIIGKSLLNLSDLIFENITFNFEKESNINNCIFNQSPLLFKDTFSINSSDLYNNNTSAITISNQNKSGSIEYCQFHDNYATNGAGVYANKGNNLIIEYNTFYHNESSNHGTSLYLNGDSLVRHNSFYTNKGKEDIYVIAGTIESEFNIFDYNNNIENNITTYLGYILANMTYWGYNDIQQAENTCNSVGDNNLISIESWLESGYHISPQPPLQNTLSYTITPFIGKYRANRDDQENIYPIEPIKWTGDYPVIINDESYSLNTAIENQTPIENNGEFIINVKIGQEEFIIK